MFRLLDRYVLRECFSPFALGVLVFTFMLLINLMFRLAEMIIQRDVPAATMLQVLALNLPNILVLTIPMALLFGVLIAIGRLSSDSELVAMRASGISLFALYRPVMLFSTVATLLTGWLMLVAMPQGNSMAEAKYSEILARSVNKQVQAGVFYDGLSEKTLFVFDVTDEGWERVFFTDALPTGEHEVVVARNARVQVVGDGSRMQIHFQGTTRHTVDLNDPDAQYLVAREDRLSAVLADDLLKRQARSQELAFRSPKSMNIAELRQWQELPNRKARERRVADVEIHQKFAIPAACLVFGLFAVPLGFNNRRGGSSSGFAMSIPIILVYHVLQSNGEGAALEGTMQPWLAMWLPNFVFLVAGLFLLWRKNGDKSLLFSAIDSWVRRRLWGRVRTRSRLRQRRQHRRREDRKEKIVRRREQAKERARSQADSRSYGTDHLATGSFRTITADEDDLDLESHPPPKANGLVIRLPRLTLNFPALIDRYLMGTFLRVFVVVVLSGITIYLLADLTELLDDIMRNDTPWDTIQGYLQALIFQAFRDLSPVVVLLTVLIGFGVLSRTNEITAAKAAGLSLYRLSVPAIVAAAIVSGGNVVLESYVLPYTNLQAEAFKAEIKGGERAAQRTFRRADRQWLYGKGGYIYHFQNYDGIAERLQRLHVFHLDPVSHVIDARMYAQEAVHLGDDQWRLAGAWRREFNQNGVTGLFTPQDGAILTMPEPPDFFDMEIKAPSQMSPAELRAYIDDQFAGGQDVHQLEVQLFNKFAMPAISLIMAFVALPFAFRLGNKGALYGVGLAIGLGIFFYAIVAVFTTLGQAGSLPPLIAVWSPHVLFASLSLYLFLGIET